MYLLIQGDWMWQFAVGIYLVHLSNGQLLLAAIFGFSGGVCVLLFGGIIGDWVDRNGRLKGERNKQHGKLHCLFIKAFTCQVNELPKYMPRDVSVCDFLIM